MDALDGVVEDCCGQEAYEIFSELVESERTPVNASLGPCKLLVS